MKKKVISILECLKQITYCTRNQKRDLRKSTIRRVKKCLKSKLNGGNMVKAINSWAVSLMRYSAEIVEWTKVDLDVTDRKARKLMTMYGMLHPRSNVADSIYRGQRRKRVT